MLAKQDPEQLGALEVSREGDPRQQAQAGAGPEGAGVRQQRDRQEDEQPQTGSHAAPQDQRPVLDVREMKQEQEQNVLFSSELSLLNLRRAGSADG